MRLLSLRTELVKCKRDRKPRKWVKHWVGRRDEKGCYLNLLKELEIEDSCAYRNFMRMSKNDFDYLLNLVAPYITKQDTDMRKAISAAEKLSLTLRYLATGETFSSLQYIFRIPKSTISGFVCDVCEAIYNVLKKDHLKVFSCLILFLFNIISYIEIFKCGFSHIFVCLSCKGNIYSA